MPDREKVIRGLTQCMMSSNRDEFETQCEDCPYFNPDVTVEECMEPLRQDAIALLKDGRWKTMPDREKVISHLNDCMEASRRDNTWVFVRKDIVEDALTLLKEQDERIKMLEHQLETITKWRANAGAFD